MKEAKRHRELIDGYCSDSLTDAEFAELEGALRKNVELRRLVLEYRMLDSDLRSIASADLPIGPVDTGSSPEVSTIRRLRIEVWAMAAAIAVLAAGVAFLGLRQASSNTVADVEPDLDHGVAVLIQAIDAQWENRQLRQGDSLAPGRWQLNQGTAELEFYSGASVILEAPAELEIVSDKGGVLHGGKLRAQVPLHAHGFTITTKDVELVDLGTSFGMEVGADSGTAVHVFEGKVELFEPDSDRRIGEGRELVSGQGSLVDPNGLASAIEASDVDFLSPSDLETQSRVLRQNGYERWRRSSATMNTDPRLLARYNFDPKMGVPRSLINRSVRDDDRLEGAIIGAQWSSGRWPGKGALEFKRPSDRVRIEVPGQHSSMTLVVWLRIDGFDNLFHSLLLSDGWDRPGAVHWQIHKQGFVELAVWHGESNQTHNSRAPFVMEPSGFGRWIQLAAVYDDKTETVSHYRDSDLSGVVKLPVVVPLAIGKAEIGNWSPPLHNSRQIRQFNGRMDEMLIFDQALSASEIADLYQNGKP